VKERERYCKRERDTVTERERVSERKAKGEREKQKKPDTSKDIFVFKKLLWRHGEFRSGPRKGERRRGGRV
jgi:hypothetical protein